MIKPPRIIDINAAGPYDWREFDRFLQQLPIAIEAKNAAAGETTAAVTKVEETATAVSVKADDAAISAGKAIKSAKAAEAAALAAQEAADAAQAMVEMFGYDYWLDGGAPDTVYTADQFFDSGGP